MPFLVKPTDYEEIPLSRETPQGRVRRLSLGKLNAYLQKNPRCNNLLLSADTLLSFQGQAMEKPKDAQQAWQFYKALAGKTHRVLTCLSLYVPGQPVVQKLEITQVRFVPWNQELYQWYLETQEWQDAAGGYKIQEKGEMLVKAIKGSYTNVVGLPLSCFYGMLAKCLNLDRSIQAGKFPF